MLGSPCHPCCPQGCDSVDDGKARTDPSTEARLLPTSGSWNAQGNGVIFSTVPNDGSGIGDVWLFYGSEATSGDGSPTDWGNICNWYSAAPRVRRATRLPDENAIVYIDSPVSTLVVGPVTVRTVYFRAINTSTDLLRPTVIFLPGSELTATTPAYGTNKNTVQRSVAGRVVIAGTINGGLDCARCRIGSVFSGFDATINGGAILRGDSQNVDTINGDTEFLYESQNRISGLINGNATFRNTTENRGTVTGNADFYDQSRNVGDSVALGNIGQVNGIATFNDDACSTRVVNIGGTLQYAAGANAPVCQGTAVSYPLGSCGCG